MTPNHKKTQNIENLTCRNASVKLKPFKFSYWYLDIISF